MDKETFVGLMKFIEEEYVKYSNFERVVKGVQWYYFNIDDKDSNTICKKIIFDLVDYIKKELNDKNDLIQKFISNDFGRHSNDFCNNVEELYDAIVNKNDIVACISKDPLEVFDCVQYDGNNKVAVQMLIGQYLIPCGITDVHYTNHKGETKTIHIGDWIVKTKDGVFVMTDEEFRERYKEI